MQKGLHPIYRVQVRILAAVAASVDEVANRHGNRLHLHSCAAYFPLFMFDRVYCRLWLAGRHAENIVAAVKGKRLHHLPVDGAHCSHT